MNPRTLAASIHDLVVATLAWVVAYQLRFNFEMPAVFSQSMLTTLWLVVPLQGAIFAMFGLYRGIWRFASIPDLRRIALAAGTAALAIPALLFMLQRLNEVPRSVLVMHPLLLVLMMGGSRFLYRAWKDGHLISPRQANAMPVIVLGAGAAASQLLRDLATSHSWRVVGLLDDQTGRVGSQLHGVSILGPLTDLPRHAGDLQVEHAIIAMPDAAPAARRRALEIAAVAGLKVFTVPAMEDVLAGRVAVSQVRQVELEDLLGRERIELDEVGLHRLLHGRVVIVTGAGGSIGSELCRQIMRFDPGRLVFFEQSEFSLYAIEQEFSGMPVGCVVGDVKDGAVLDAVFGRDRPDVVFHAAAYKHVPLMENGNAWAAVRNNVMGTLRVARAAMGHGVGEFVLISTDKAVNPTNVMGASKRLAERVCEALQCEVEGMRFVIVRFGNVLGSSGSVIPKFREQIDRGGPVTVTHPDIIRYFMLIPEAAQLVLQAGLMGKGGELFVLDMGEPVNIADLARDMIRLSGFSEDDIKIEFTGLRPGEKLYEELLADGETTLPTPHPKLRVMRAETAPDAAWLAELEQWLSVPVRSEAEVKEGLKRWVPEYRPAQH
ncbi:MAG: polysaccharide biosynthesis protein [Gammaproteobacteria bacterium]|nr:polysaccharide biosynthesis protein [Gammaproteobacteria bacterium]MBU1972413.1 polysaccharide biosynthesis protein [Gammaproteobacteria bacterium]